MYSILTKNKQAVSLTKYEEGRNWKKKKFERKCSFPVPQLQPQNNFCDMQGINVYSLFDNNGIILLHFYL